MVGFISSIRNASFKENSRLFPYLFLIFHTENKVSNNCFIVIDNKWLTWVYFIHVASAMFDSNKQKMETLKSQHIGIAKWILSVSV